MDGAEASGRKAHMMLLDATFEDSPPSAPHTPPTIRLYGVGPNGESICCIINDFIPYFWFTAPICTDDLKELNEEVLDKLREKLNEQVLTSKRKHTVQDRSFVAGITLSFRTPLMYYRPGGPFQFLKVEIWRSKYVSAVAKELEILAQSNILDIIGLKWQECTSYEDGIKLGMRFFCDTNISGGGWVEIESPSIVHISKQRTSCSEELMASWTNVRGLTPDATQFMEFSLPSKCQSDASRAIQIGKSQWLCINSLRILILDVQCGRIECSDYRGSTFSPGKLKKPRLHSPPKVREISERSTACIKESSKHMKAFEDIEAICTTQENISLNSWRDPVLVITTILISGDSQRTFVFMHGVNSQGNVPGAKVHVFDNEQGMLLAWQDFFCTEADPDVVCLYQLKDSIRYLAERVQALKLGTLNIGRFKGQATEVKSVVSYGKHWVKSQARMTATSNQEVFRAVITGRIVIDMLRVILVAYNLSTFTLAECSQVYLGKTKEVLDSVSITELWRGQHGGVYRLVNYSINEAAVTWELMKKLQTIPETIEMARVTGLSVSDSIYKAQMIRVQSLLLRSAKKEGWLLGGPTATGQLSESPFLIHPKASRTTGFYKDPVVVLDFASLYPSVFIAYNLCYTTLVHPKDLSLLPKESLMESPTGAKFVIPAIRYGILPRICGALIRARELAKKEMLSETITNSECAVLDARQKALKLCSNALYGFTGAGTSPQQAVPLADSCLSIGASSCKHAVELVKDTFKHARVLYAQTDSVFIQFCGSTIKEAIELGKKAANVTSTAFPFPMSLKLEKILCPFLLLQVNRYAGKDVSSVENEKTDGALFIRGIESERRDVPQFVRMVCKSVLQEILLKGDMDAAVDVCKHEIRRLLSGKCSMMELVMTGGLWRVDNNDICRLANSKSPKKDGGSSSTAEEGRGPHVALAIRLKRRDPDREFHIGERIQYVLVKNSSKMQDDMAEHPLTALRENMQLNFHVYLENKLRKPLESILEYVMDASNIHDIFMGSHTAASHIGSTNSTTGQISMTSYFKRRSLCLSCRKPFDDGGGDEDGLCEECRQMGAAPGTLLSLMVENRENEKRLLGAQGACMHCHSGGLCGKIMCTNTDCPVFYMRCEAPRAFRKLVSSMKKLEL